MKMAINDGRILIKEADDRQCAVIRSWGRMKWDRAAGMFCGDADADLLNRLARLVRLPEPAERLRLRLNRIAEAVDAERLREDPKPLYPYPVKIPLYRHQIRGANMALMVLGLVDPPDPPDPGKEATYGKGTA